MMTDKVEHNTAIDKLSKIGITAMKTSFHEKMRTVLSGRYPLHEQKDICNLMDRALSEALAEWNNSEHHGGQANQGHLQNAGNEI